LRKKQFTSFDVAAVVRELSEAILDSRVSNVYQSSNKTLLFKLRKVDKPVFWLALDAGRRLHLTSYAVEKPKGPPAFCMALRKYLRNGWLTGVEQYEFERVVVFTFKTKAGVMRLFLELFGDGNIILVGENGKILQALSYKRMRDRNILRGEVFRFPPPSGKNPLKVSKQDLLQELRDFGDVEVVRALTRFLGVGGFYAEEILLRAGVNKKTPCNALSDAMVDAVFENLRDILAQVTSGELEPCVVLDENGSFVDVAPFGLKRYTSFNHQPYGSFNEALDEFYVRVGAIQRALVAAAGDVEELRNEKARLKRIFAGQEKVLIEAEATSEKNRRIGDVIYAHSGELQTLLNMFLAGKTSGIEWGEVVSEVLAEKKAGLTSGVFESFDDNRLVVNVCVDSLCFGLSLRKSLFDNAARFYEQSKRAKRKMKGARVALEETREKLDEVEAKIYEAEELGKIEPAKVVEEIVERKIKRKEWFEKFRWFVSSDGFLVVAGKDAVSNEVLVKKYTEVKDVVFHADVVGAPFVVVKTEGKEPSQQVLRIAGEFAAAFSRGWREGFASADVYWVKPDQLSKGGPSGEYVPRGGFVVRGKRNWMRGVSLKVAVGVVVEEDGEVMFVGGPVDAVITKTKAYVVVVPGDSKGKAFFKRVLKILAGKIPEEHGEKVLKSSVENIRRFIPYSKGRVLED
jgi:predicted ribosome quality control (RQC) complex YloA/Tae2 family protein